MTTNFHTPIANGASNAASTWNTPLAALDGAISAVSSAGGQFTLANGGTSTTTLDVDSTSGFVVGATVVYTYGAGSIEYNTIAAVNSSTRLTLTNTPTGAIADNAVIAQVTPDVKAAAQIIKYGNGVVPTLTNAMDWSSGRQFFAAAYAVPSDGSDAKGALDAMITAMSNGDTLVLSPGATYTINNASGWTISKSIRLMGNGATIALGANCDNVAGIIVSANHVQIHDLAIQGYDTNFDNTALQTDGTRTLKITGNHCVLSALRISSSIVGVEFYATAGGVLRDSYLYNGTITSGVGTNNNHVAIFSQGANDIRIENNYVDGHGQGFSSGSSAGIPYRNIIIGNTFVNADDNGIYVSSGEKFIISSNTVRNFDSSGIKARGSYHNVSNNFVEGVGTPSAGIVITGAGTVDATLYTGRDTIVTANVIKGSYATSGWALALDDSSGGMMRTATFANNIVDVSTACYGMIITNVNQQSSGVVIANNTFRGVRTAILTTNPSSSTTLTANASNGDSVLTVADGTIFSVGQPLTLFMDDGTVRFLSVHASTAPTSTTVTLSAALAGSGVVATSGKTTLKGHGHRHMRIVNNFSNATTEDNIQLNYVFDSVIANNIALNSAASTEGINLLSSVRNIVSGNRLGNTETTGAQRYGIYEQNACDWNHYTDNVIYGATIREYQTAGANTLVPVDNAKIETLTGTKSPTIGEARTYITDPGGASRSFNPSSSLTWPVGYIFVIVNTADAAETITFDTTGLNQAIAQNQRGIFVRGNGAWHKIFVG